MISVPAKLTTSDRVINQIQDSMITSFSDVQRALNNATIIGEVKMSPLTEGQFQAQSGINWVLMQGQNVQTSQYSKITGNKTVPPANVTVPNMNFFIRIN